MLTLTIQPWMWVPIVMAVLVIGLALYFSMTDSINSFAENAAILLFVLAVLVGLPALAGWLASSSILQPTEVTLT